MTNKRPRRQKKHDRLTYGGAPTVEVQADMALAPFDKAMRDACSVDGCDGQKYLRGFCNAHYLRWKRHGSPTAGGTSKGEPKRWLSKLVADPPDECVAWPFGSNGNGYGWSWHEGKRIGAHRLALVLATGENPAGLVAAHSCHNRQCVNPKHLSWETQSTNLRQERDLKNSSGKLTALDVKKIRASKEKPTVLAKTFGVSRDTIYLIRRGRIWDGV